MILFYKLKKPYEDYEDFIKQFLPYEKYDLQALIMSIIDNLKTQNIILIMDQYQEELFPYSSFITDLKSGLLEKNSKIKIIISSTLNNGKIGKTYLDIIFGEINNKNKKIKEINEEDDYIPYHFLEKKLVNDNEIKNYIKTTNKHDGIKLNNTLKLFNFLPLYYYLCKQY